MVTGMGFVRRSKRPVLTSLALLAMGLLLAGCGQAAPEGIAVGAPAPDFTLTDATGGTVSLDDFKGEQPVLLFFHMAMG